jgi:hypothetical protein
MSFTIQDMIERRRKLAAKLALLDRKIEAEVLRLAKDAGAEKVRNDAEGRLVTDELANSSKYTLSSKPRKPRNSAYEEIVREYIENLEMEVVEERNEIENGENPVFLIFMADLSVATIAQGLQKRHPERFREKKEASIAYRVRRTDAWQEFKKERQPRYKTELSKKSAILNNPLNRTIPLEKGVHVVKGR